MDKHTPQWAVLDEKGSVHQVFVVATFSPQHEGSAQCWGKLWPWADVPQPGRAAGEVPVVAVAAPLLVVHLFQVPHQQATCSASGFAYTLFQTVVTWSRGERSRGRSKGQERQRSQGPPFVPAACRAWHGTQNHPGGVFCPALSPTSTGIPSENIFSPQRAQSQPVPRLRPTAHLESNQAVI